jgi:hypothetical protein
MTAFRSMPGNEGAARAVIAGVNLDCAIEIAEALVGLTVAVRSLEQNSMLVMNKLLKEIETSTAQTKTSSQESGKVALESANLSRKLNRLTIWIVIAAIVSAGAAAVQASVAWYTVHKPQQAVILPASSPASPAAPLPK